MRSLRAPGTLLACLLAVPGFACGGDGNMFEPAVPTNIAVSAGNHQFAAPGQLVATAPSVTVTDASANPVSGVVVTFAVASGGGSITAPDQTTNASGIATVGSWTLGPADGTNTLTASAGGLTGSPVSFTATGTANPPIIFQSLAAGLDHTCGLTPDGTAYCWGSNEFGQLGDGSTTNRLAPVRVSGKVKFQSLALGGSHSCGLAAGLAYCWGRNIDGELGDGAIVQRLSPTPITGGLVFQSLAGGYYHTCGLTPAGAAYCWGLNSSGQLGDGYANPHLTPTPVTGALTFRSLAAGDSHTCGLTEASVAYCWGSGGLIGNGWVQRLAPTPLAVIGGLTFASLAAGARHTCGVSVDAVTYCWGWNEAGQLGYGSASSLVLAPVSSGVDHNFRSVALGESHSCGLTASGAAYCWGSNPNGQLGDGSTTQWWTPVAVMGGLTFRSLTAGAGYHTCGLAASGIAYCWGYNRNGGLGDGTSSDRLTPTPVSAVP